MQGKPLVMLALAGTLGLGAMLMTSRLLSKKSTSEEPTRDVLVAVRDFKEEEILKPDMLKTVRMAESAVPVGAFASAQDVADRWVRTAVLEGEPVVERKLGPKGSPPGLVANIPKGKRAFAVEVNEQSGVSGFILPSHRVDVIKFENSDDAVKRGQTILQDVLVLAAGQVFVKSEEKSLQSRTVTLAVSPDEVDVLVAAKSKGTLSLALRGVNDHDVIERPEPPPATDDGAEKKKQIELEKTIAQLKQDHEQEKKRRIELEKAALKTPPVPSRMGYIYRIPGSKQEPFFLAGRASQPSPPLPPETPPESPDDSEDVPQASPTSLVAGGLVGASRENKP
ncbi:Flp pilus assembly protein CpaB [Paludisphaera borealis]|uniref:SAF domain-containing protein n=1 Tax=Paludisphaera borealis TaxID=1387353 RepID=A0A1U7CLL3_9BACT|nr:Flp pilus assembly protein CpaB [Paludisphaera borealis]APW59834.1 hypothetical protein BSF38_01292 [Paludisphaera borealis]